MRKTLVSRALGQPLGSFYFWRHFALLYAVRLTPIEEAAPAEEAAAEEAKLVQ